MHPFLDASAFPWHLPEAKPFWVALYQGVPQPARIDFFYKSCAPDLPPLAPGGPDVVWKDALEHIARARLLAALLTSLETGAPQTVIEQVRKIRNAVAITDRTVLRAESRRFLDRKELRTSLTRLAALDDLAKVLVIRGELGSGRTWTRHIVESLAFDRGEASLYYCEGLYADVDGLVADLFDRFDAAHLVPSKTTTPEAWYKNVCSKLQVAAKQAGKPCWIVIDDLDSDANDVPWMDVEIRRFFEQLALFMVNQAYREWIRLVLIAYPHGGVPAKWKREHYLIDEPRIETIDAGHVAAHLDEWASNLGRAILPQDRDAIAALVVAAGDAAAKDKRLETIHDKLGDELVKLGGGA